MMEVVKPINGIIKDRGGNDLTLFVLLRTSDGSCHVIVSRKIHSSIEGLRALLSYIGTKTTLQ